MVVQLATKEPLPLSRNVDGAIRIAGTRVTLDTVVEAFADGATPEEIVQQYPSLSLADVYSVIGYYLRRREKVESYLRDRRAAASKVRKENEARFSPKGIRARLLARRKEE